jgi:hypothetical protein
MLFSYVILCDFFPLYDFQCVLTTEEQHRDIKTIAKQSILMNLTRNEYSSSNFRLQQHNRPTTSEIILTVWVFTLFCEEIRQVNQLILFNYQQIFDLLRSYP